MNSTSGGNRETEAEAETETMRAAAAMLSLAEPTSPSSKSNSPSPSSNETESPLPAQNTLIPTANISSVYYNTYSHSDSGVVVSVSVSDGLSARSNNNSNFITHTNNIVTNSARSSIDIDTNPRTSTDTTTGSTTGSTGTSTTRRPLPCEACRTQRKRCSTDRPSCVRCRDKNISCHYNYLAKKLDPDAQQVSKRALACVSCHFKKIKCSMERPECLNCKNRGQTCQYFVTLSELPPIPPAPISSSLPAATISPVFSPDYQPPFSANNSAMSDSDATISPHTPMSPVIPISTSSSLPYTFSPASANGLSYSSEYSNNLNYTMTRAHTTPTLTTTMTASTIFEPEPRPSTSSTSSSISYVSTASFASSVSSSIPSVSNPSKYRFSGLRGRSQSVWATVSSALVRNPLSSAARSSPIPAFSTLNHQQQQQQQPYQQHQYQSQYQKFKSKKDAKLAQAALADLAGVAPNPTSLGSLVVSRLPKLAAGTQKRLKSGKLWIMNPDTGEKGYFCPACLKEYSTSNGLK
ncbi:hypothetical protein HK100_006420, partial [Physocladia obscura]